MQLRTILMEQSDFIQPPNNDTYHLVNKFKESAHSEWGFTDVDHILDWMVNDDWESTVIKTIHGYLQGFFSVTDMTASIIEHWAEAHT